MTIKIERDAILSVINNGNSSAPSCHSPLSSSVEDCLLREKLRSRYDEDNDIPSCQDSSMVDFFRETLTPDLDETDDDDSTVSSFSTAKGVRFADPLVTGVIWRPRTLKKHIRDLFYSVEETQRFRQEYREERRLKAQDDATFNSSTSSTGEPGSEANDNGSSGQDTDSSHNKTNHRISCVEVVHKNIRETFIDRGMKIDDMSQIPTRDDYKMASDDFFDNDSFWSGQVTWY